MGKGTFTTHDTIFLMDVAKTQAFLVIKNILSFQVPTPLFLLPFFFISCFRLPSSVTESFGRSSERF